MYDSLLSCATILGNVLLYVFKVLMMGKDGKAGLMASKPVQLNNAWTAGLFISSLKCKCGIILHVQSSNSVRHKNKNTTGGENLNYTSDSGCQTANIQYPGFSAESKTMTGCMYILRTNSCLEGGASLWFPWGAWRVTNCRKLQKQTNKKWILICSHQKCDEIHNYIYNEKEKIGNEEITEIDDQSTRLLCIYLVFVSLNPQRVLLCASGRAVKTVLFCCFSCSSLLLDVICFVNATLLPRQQWTNVG